MRTTTAGLLSLALFAGLGTLTQMPASAAPQADKTNEPRLSTPSDSLPNPIADKQNALREEAVADVLSGDAKPQTIDGNSVLKVGREPAASSKARGANATQPQYVELENERTDRVFVFLVDFGNERHPDYPDQDTHPATPGPTKFEGPGFNEIPQPGPDDNSTGWEPDFNKEYYENLYFGEGADVESLKTYYEKQSSGRYCVDGEVTDVTTVQYNEARYGRSNGFPCAGNVCDNTWAIIRDGMTQWVADQQAAGQTDEQIKPSTSRRIDVLDRYDYDGDGNFDEADGYLDRFQIVHAGGDQADGDPIQGEDAIWSHRWFTSTSRPATHRPGVQQGRRQRDRRPPASGSATTPSRPRTAGSRPSRTSTATTWGCPTTTTPQPPVTTRSAGGP